MNDPVPPHQGTSGFEERVCDPLAAALGNASLLGIGYLLLGRRRLAKVSVFVTLALAVLLATVRQVGVERVVLLWWVFVIGHGWYLARSRLRRTGPGAASLASPGTAPQPAAAPPAAGQRVIAALVTVPVLLAVGLHRSGAEDIRRRAAEAHRDGDCERALSILDELSIRHRVANGPLTVRTDAEAEACRLLTLAKRQERSDRPLAARTLQRYAAHPAALWQGADDHRATVLLAQAAGEFDAALTGDVKALKAGYERLDSVLKEFPRREQDAGKVVDRLLDRLPVKNACDTRAIADWLRARSKREDVLDRARSGAAKLAPVALVECGDDLAADKRWKEARKAYRALVADYPDHKLVATAKRGIRKATLAIQLANVKKLIKPGGSGGLPAYCSKPARYEGAPRYRGSGPHRALLFGQKEHRAELPSSWLTNDPADATLVICAGETEFGTKVRTCSYRTTFNRTVSVSFYKEKIPVRVYELRTGALFTKTNLQISGKTCPHYIYYSSYYIDDDPPSRQLVEPTRADIRAAYRPLINP
jgi:hypothetical protein